MTPPGLPPDSTPTVSPALRAHRAELRSQFAFSFLVASVPLAVFGALLVLRGEPMPFGITDLVLGGAVLGIRQWVLAKPDNERMTAGCLAIGTLGLFIIGWHALFTGQSSSFALWYLPCIPVLTALLGTARMSAGFAVACSLVAVGVLASERFVHIAPAFDLPGWMLVILHIMLIGVTGAYSVAARQTNDAHARRLELAWAEADAARRAADVANRAKSEFLAIMSHEIRTPLNGVVGLNSLLLSVPLDDKARHYAELARQSGEALLSLVNDFLDFSKIEAGRMELVSLPFSPSQAIDDAVATVRESARVKGLALMIDVAVPPALRGDAARLRQVLVNLLSNAVKFTARGSVTLRCKARADGKREWLCIDVIDTGIGIDEDTQRRLFQPFSQADASTTRRFGGTGLGLAICRALTDLMGGRIGLESKVGEGSRFWVELPFDSVPGAGPLGALTAVPVPAPAAGGARGRVLVAEDNPVNQIVALEMLRRLGFSVDLAMDGQQAVEAVLANHYDLVLMDCEMPGLDGFQASREIRRREFALRHVPIVAMTASALSGDRERCLAAGMDDYLAKPVRLADVERIVSHWIHERPTHG